MALVPLLFLIDINDMPSQVSKGTCIPLFADDCLVYRQIQNVNDQTILKQDLDYLHNWAVPWGMTFNPSNSYIMHITRARRLHKFYQMCGTILGTITQAKYLGITIRDDLHLHQQTDQPGWGAVSDLSLILDLSKKFKHGLWRLKSKLKLSQKQHLTPRKPTPRCMWYLATWGTAHARHDL